MIFTIRLMTAIAICLLLITFFNDIAQCDDNENEIAKKTLEEAIQNGRLAPVPLSSNCDMKVKRDKNYEICIFKSYKYWVDLNDKMDQKESINYRCCMFYNAIDCQEETLASMKLDPCRLFLPKFELRRDLLISYLTTTRNLCTDSTPKDCRNYIEKQKMS